MIGKQKVTLPRILVAVCDHELRLLLKRALEQAAYAVDECLSRTELRNTLGSLSGARDLEKFDVLLFDKRLLYQRAVKLIRGLQDGRRLPPMVLVKAGHGDRPVLVEAITIFALCDRPADVARYKALIRWFVPHRQLE